MRTRRLAAFVAAGALVLATPLVAYAEEVVPSQEEVAIEEVVEETTEVAEVVAEEAPAEVIEEVIEAAPETVTVEAPAEVVVEEASADTVEEAVEAVADSAPATDVEEAAPAVALTSVETASISIHRVCAFDDPRDPIASEVIATLTWEGDITAQFFVYENGGYATGFSLREGEDLGLFSPAYVNFTRFGWTEGDRVITAEFIRHDGVVLASAEETFAPCVVPGDEVTIVDIPASPGTVNDNRLVKGDAEWDVPSDDETFQWTVDDEGNLIVAIIAEDTTFPDGSTLYNFGLAPDEYAVLWTIVAGFDRDPDDWAGEQTILLAGRGVHTDPSLIEEGDIPLLCSYDSLQWDVILVASDLPDPTVGAVVVAPFLPNTGWEIWQHRRLATADLAVCAEPTPTPDPTVDPTPEPSEDPTPTPEPSEDPTPTPEPSEDPTSVQPDGSETPAGVSDDGTARLPETGADGGGMVAVAIMLVIIGVATMRLRRARG